MAVLNYEGLRYFYDQLIAHFASQSDVNLNFETVRSDIININSTLATKQDKTQVQNLIDSAINQLVDGAPEALNTLNELAAALGDDKDYYQTIDDLINGIKNTLNTKANADELGAHIANKANPHEVTIVEEGEGNIVSSFENGAQIVAHKDAYGFSKKEGNVVQENCLEDMPIQIKTILRPTQEGSGNPYPAGCGKNLLPYPYKNTTITTNGITFTDNGDGTITINGTSTGAAYFNFYTAGHDFGNDNMTIPANATNGVYTFSILDAGLGGLNLRYDGTNKKCFISINSGYTFSNLTIYPMIEEGTVKTDWEPYSNIRPIMGRKNAELVRCGKNLFGTTWEQGSISGETGADTNSSAEIRSGYIAVDESQTYTLFRTISTKYTKARCYDENKKYIGTGTTGLELIKGSASSTAGNPMSDGSNQCVIKVKPGVKYLRFCDTSNDLTTHYQLELGSTFSTLESYQGDTFALDFGQEVYGGTLDWNTGLLSVDMVYKVLDGSESWAKASKANTFYFDYYSNGLNPGNASLLDSICSHYKTAKNTSFGDETAYYPLNYTNNLLRNLFVDLRYNDIASWKAYLAEQVTAGTPVQVVYKLLEPISTIQLSPLQIKSLKGTNTIYSMSGTSSVIFNSELLNYDITPISVKQTSNFITVKNGIEGYGFKATSIIEPQQSGYGNPYPAGEGKQLFDISSNTSGVTVDADDWITIEFDNTSGTSTGYKSVYTPPSTKIVAGKQYTSVFEIKEISNGSLIGVDTENVNSNKSQFATAHSNITSVGTHIKQVTARTDLSGCVTMTRTNFCTTAGKVGKIVFRISILDDLTITENNFSYTPYANIRSISGLNELNLTRHGKNLINSSVFTSGTIYGATVTRNGDYYVINGTPTQSGVKVIDTLVLEPGTYTISHKNISGTYTSDQYNYVVQLVDKVQNKVLARTFLNETSESYTITEPLEVTVRIYGRGNAVYNNFTFVAQLEKNVVATEYEPYIGNTFTLSLGETVYGGKLDWNTGVLTVDRAYIEYNGSETGWSNGGSNFFIAVPNISTSDAKLTSNQFIDAPTISVNKLSATQMRQGATPTNVVFGNPTNMSVAAWKERLSNNPLQLCYTINNPYTIQLTPQHLTMLQGENNFYSNSSSLKVKSNTSIENYYTLDSFNLPTPEKIFTKESVIPIVNGGTGSNSRAGAWTNIVAAGGTFTDNITVDKGTKEPKYALSRVVNGATYKGLLCINASNSVRIGLYDGDWQQLNYMILSPTATTFYKPVAIGSGGTGATTKEQALINLGLTATAAELNYVDGVTSNIQTQLNAKLASNSANYIKSLSISGKTITYTKGDGNTGTLTTQDTTYSTATSSTLGLVKIGYTQSGKNYPVQLSGGKMYVNVPWTDNDTTYSNMTAATSSAAGKAGLVPAPAAGKQNSFLRGDGTWVVPNNTTYTFATGDSNGQIKVTPSGGSAQNISVKGLGSAAYKDASGSWGISITGKAATATALASSAGSTELPVYFKDGKPVVINNIYLGSKTSNDYRDVRVQRKSSSDASAGMIYFGIGSDATTGQIGFQHFNTSGTQDGGWNAMFNSAALYPGANDSIYLGTTGYKWKAVYATTFYGNASSATKATQDGDGNTITSHYMPKSGGTFTGALTGNSSYISKGTMLLQNSDRYPQLHFQPKFSSTPCFKIYSDAGSETAFVSGARTWFRQYSFTANSTSVSTYFEDYKLPSVTVGRTANGSFDILTTKSKVTLSQGGTGANLSEIPAGAVVRNSTDGSGLWYSTTASGAFYATAANGKPSFGTLPIAQGGTGATSAANALTSLGIVISATQPTTGLREGLIWIKTAS